MRKSNMSVALFCSTKTKPAIVGRAISDAKDMERTGYTDVQVPVKAVVPDFLAGPGCGKPRGLEVPPSA